MRLETDKKHCEAVERMQEKCAVASATDCARASLTWTRGGLHLH
jgi:hypothetical protein